MVVGIVDHAELPWRHAMNLLVGVDEVAVSSLLDRCRMILRRVANLKGDARGQIGDAFGKEVEVVDGKIALIGLFGVIAVAHVENVLFYILLDDEPRTAPQTEPLALPYGMEPQSAVLAYLVSRLEFDNVARLFS